MSKSSKLFRLFRQPSRRRERELQRVLRAELLESRTLMAGDANPWHNTAFRGDVDGDGSLTPRDALLVVNELNEGGARDLRALIVSNAAAGGEAEGNYQVDVNNDGWVAPTDVLELVNALNDPEGEPALMKLGITATKLDGTALPIDAGTGLPAVNVGESFLVQMVTQDLRVNPQGVFAAYADVTFNNKVAFDERETQLLTFNSAPNSGTFTLTVSVPGQAAKTTGSITYSKTNPQTTRDNIVAALLAPGIGFFLPGEVIAEKPRPKSSGPSEGTNYAVKFGGRYADLNMPEMTATWTGAGSTTITVQQYNTWVTTPPVPTTPDFRMSLTYDMFRDAMTASLGEGANPNVLNEAGATTLDTSDGAEYLVFETQFTALAGGTVTFGTNVGEDSASAPLLHGSGGANITAADVLFDSLNIVVLQKVTAGNDSATVTEDSLATQASNRINVLANDTLNAGGSKRIVSFTQGANGTVTRFDNGNADPSDDQLIYQPNANFAGSDTFTYVFGDGNGNTTTGTVSMTVTAVNDGPTNTVPAGAQSTAEDTAKTYSTANSNAFSINDIDAGTAAMQVQFTATNGTVSLVNGAGVTVTGGGASITLTGSQANINTALGAGLTFTPANQFSGNATLVMATSDEGNTGAAPAGQTNPLRANNTVTIAVTAQNDAPVNTLPAGLQTDEGQALTITTIAVADVDAGTSPVVVDLSVTAGSGLLQLLQTAGVTVTNNNSAALRITGSVSAINTALLAGVRFTPAAGFAGNTTLTMVTNDQGNTGAGGSLTDTDSVALDVRPLVRPRASNDNATAAEDSLAASNVINVLSNDTPNPTATLVLKSFTQPANGTVTRSGDNLLFAPTANFTGQTTFTYTINDSLEGTANGGVDSTATVTVTVTEVNDAPTAGNDTASGVEDIPLTIAASALTSNDSPGPGESTQTLTIASAAIVSPSGGTVAVNGAGNVVYTPPANYNGQAVLTYTVRDNGKTNGVDDFKTATATVTVTLSEVNDAPTAGTDTGITTPEDPVSPLTIAGTTLTANDGPGGGTDEAGQTLTVQSVSAVTAGAGTVTLNAGNVIYSPAGNYNGPFVFTYVVSDNGTTNGAADAKTATGTVTVTVTEVNDAPTAGNDAVTGVKNTPSEFTSAQLLANDGKGPANESGQTLRISAVSPTSTLGGTVSLNSTTGVITYTPPTGIDGQSDSFTYTVTDNGTTNGAADHKSATGTVTVGIVNFIPMTVSGHVYMDLDNDGVKDASEPVLAGVDVTLSGTDFNGQTIANQTVLTDRSGFYQFTNLAPGNYFITEGAPANMVDGRETPGSTRLSTSGNDRFSFVMSLTDNVGLTNHTFANNNFGERSLSSSYLSIHYLIVPNVNGTDPIDTPEGLLFSFADAAATNLDWYSIQDGWAGNNFVSLTLSGDRQSATLRMTNNLNQVVQTTVTCASGRLRVQTDSAGRPVAYVHGSFSDFNWTVVSNGGSGEGEGEEAASAELLLAAVLGDGSASDYAAAVDAALAATLG
ncbi:MAG: Ig-like domain-containing protein [Pirellulales bacterium]